MISGVFLLVVADFTSRISLNVKNRGNIVTSNFTETAKIKHMTYSLLSLWTARQGEQSENKIVQSVSFYLCRQFP